MLFFLHAFDGISYTFLGELAFLISFKYSCILLEYLDYINVCVGGVADFNLSWSSRADFFVVTEQIMENRMRHL